MGRPDMPYPNKFRLCFRCVQPRTTGIYLFTQMSILWVTDTQMTPYGENGAHSTPNFSATVCIPFSISHCSIVVGN